MPVVLLLVVLVLVPYGTSKSCIVGCFGDDGGARGRRLEGLLPRTSTYVERLESREWLSWVMCVAAGWPPATPMYYTTLYVENCTLRPPTPPRIPYVRIYSTIYRSLFSRLSSIIVRLRTLEYGTTIRKSTL